jgi:hypothetical protein
MADFIRSIQSSASEPARGRFYRLAVTSDTDPDTVRIADERATSGAATAQRIEDGDGDVLFLTPEETRWLHATLGELIAVWDRSNQ